MSLCFVRLRVGLIDAASAMSFGGLGGGNGPPNVQSVRKCLFGEPDHEQTQRDLQQQISEAHQRDARKWDFDFVAQQPIASEDARYVWTRCDDSNNNDINSKDEQISTKLSKESDEPIATHNTTQSHSAIATSVSVSPDSQSSATSSSATVVHTSGRDVNQSATRVKSAKQTTITTYLPGRKSADSERKRSTKCVSHDESVTQTKRHRTDSASAVKGSDSDTQREDVEDECETVQIKSTGTAV